MKYSLIKEMIDSKYNNMALATIVKASGSSPRDSGASMLVFEDEKMRGTIGGGPVEKEVFDESIKLLKNNNKIKNKKIHFDISNEDAAQVGGICGGQVDVLIEIINLKEGKDVT